MKKLLRKIKSFALTHKFWSAIIVIAIATGGYYAYAKSTSTSGETRYVLGTVTKGTVIASVTGTGQVVALDQVDIKPKVGGDVTYVGVKSGDKVSAGTVIATIDSTDAVRAVADAEHSLNQAKLQYQKDSAQAPIDNQNAIQSETDAETALKTTYNDTFNTISNTYLNLPAVMTGMQNILYGYTLSQTKNQWNVDIFKNMFNDAGQTTINTMAASAESDYAVARAKYDKSLTDYKTLNRYSDNASLEKILTESTDMTTAVAQALQSQLNLLDAITDYAQQINQPISSAISTLRNSAAGYLATANSTLSNLLSQQKLLDAAKTSVTNAKQNIQILQIGNSTGDNPISLQSSAYNIQTLEQNLANLQDALADYTIRAPFAGTIAAIDVKKFDGVSSGTVIATMITSKKVAKISLNELDAAKIKVGQKATVTFDAIESLSITGQVSEVDSLGTVSQGVVSYAIQINFDTEDDRIKSGMTVNVSIQTDVHTDALLVPTGAVKTQNGASYVQIFSPAFSNIGGTNGVTSATPPQSVPVEIGISDDVNVEILSGLKEGDQMVTRTITGSTAAKTSTATTNTAANRGAGGFGGGIRIP